VAAVFVGQPLSNLRHLVGILFLIVRKPQQGCFIAGFIYFFYIHINIGRCLCELLYRRFHRLFLSVIDFPFFCSFYQPNKNIARIVWLCRPDYLDENHLFYSNRCRRAFECEQSLLDFDSPLSGETAQRTV